MTFNDFSLRINRMLKVFSSSVFLQFTLNTIMKSIKFCFLFFLFFASSGIYSQQEQFNSETNKSGKDTEINQLQEINNLPDTDYKIIASNSQFIEIEFNPYYIKRKTINISGQESSIFDFENSVRPGMLAIGKPDLPMRIFPIILPIEKNNSVIITDADYIEIGNIDIPPVPDVKFRNVNQRNFEDFEWVYNKDNTYSKGEYYPANIAALEETGYVRELIMTSLVIYPVQFNPITRTIKQYTRIRVRINFGGQPIFLNRIRSREEISLLRDIALNSNIALNWMNPNLSLTHKSPVQNSVMTNGDWYWIKVTDNGSGNSESIYKISKSFLESAGINLSGVDPRTIKMYGNGGEILPISYEDPRPGDLQEIRIYIEGENDGVFDSQDYILFYGKSINNWIYDPMTTTYSHTLNPYSLSNYYWIKIGSSDYGLRMNTESSQNVQDPMIPTSFTEKLFYEPEINNLLFEGNLWLSERKQNGQSFNWSNTLTGLEANSDIFYRTMLASRVLGSYTNYFYVKEDNSYMSELYVPLPNVAPGFGNWIGRDDAEFTLNASQFNPPNSEQSKFRATFNTNSPDGEGYLDWMEIQYKRRLNSFTNDFARFTSIDAIGTVEYNVGSFSSSSVRVFDATEHNGVVIIQPLQATQSNVKFQRNQQPEEIRKFFVIGPNGYKTPSAISQRIENQNYRGITDGASFVIITHKDFLPAANWLKQRRETVTPLSPIPLKTYIFECQKIYNEFSGGVLDAVAIRDFLKYAYDNWNEKPVYVLFLGDGDFDYKNILTNDSNWVPAYEVTDPNINQVAGYTSDDFYVDVVGNTKPDMSNGRIPARSLDQAVKYFDKVSAYEDPLYNGYWKNKAVYVADDGITPDQIEGSLHTDQVEQLAEFYTPSSIDKVKLYLVLYPAIITSTGRRKPGVNKDIIKNWTDGCLMINYTGHGSPDVWAHEYVLEKDVAISQVANVNKFPFVTIASCDFSKFDNPLVQSGGEIFMITPGKGAIGTLAATRPVYSGENADLNNKFWTSLLFPRDTLLQQIRYGKGLFQAKQNMGNFTINSMKFILMSDPSLRVQQPRFTSRVDSITGLSGDTMRALSKIKIYGSILLPDSSLWSDYNGKIFFKIFDVTKNIHMVDEVGSPFNFKLNGGIIFSGTQLISNGKWSVEFIVPKDISYLNQNGKLINYFYNTTQGDGSSINTSFIVGGFDPNAPLDTTGPNISLYLDSRNFRSGDIINENFTLIADLSDESGINTTGTIGHKIEAILDGNETQKYDLTTYYNSDTSYRFGSLSYDFSSISEGKHKLKLIAWDTYNNSSETEIDFNVTLTGNLLVTNVYNYPNPFKDKTSFTFQHSYPDNINVKIKIYTVAGRLIKEIVQNNVSDKFVMINWEGTDEDGETLSNGIYIYKLIIDDGSGNSVTSTGKLAVLK